MAGRQTLTITAASSAVVAATTLSIGPFNDDPTGRTGTQAIRTLCRFVNSAGAATLQAQVIRRSDSKVIKRINAAVTLPATARRSSADGSSGEYLAECAWEDSGNDRLDLGGLGEEGVCDISITAQAVTNVDANNQLYVEVVPIRTT